MKKIIGISLCVILGASAFIAVWKLESQNFALVLFLLPACIMGIGHCLTD